MLQQTSAYIEERDPVIVAGVELGGVRTVLAVPMLKENELIGRLPCPPGSSVPLPTSRSRWSRTSPTRPSSPSRMRGCSTNCANRWSSRRPRQRCSMSSAARRSISTRCLKPWSKVRSGCAGRTEGTSYRFDGELLRVAVAFNALRELKEFVERNPIPPGRNSACCSRRARTPNGPHSRCLADPEYSWGGKDVDAVRTILGGPDSQRR